MDHRNNYLCKVSNSHFSGSLICFFFSSQPRSSPQPIHCAISWPIKFASLLFSTWWPQVPTNLLNLFIPSKFSPLPFLSFFILATGSWISAGQNNAERKAFCSPTPLFLPLTNKSTFSFNWNSVSYSFYLLRVPFTKPSLGISLCLFLISQFYWNQQRYIKKKKSLWSKHQVCSLKLRQNFQMLLIATSCGTQRPFR